MAKEKLSITREKQKKKFSHGDRVRIAQGTGTFLYWQENRGVIHMDERYYHKDTGLTVSHLYAKAEDIKEI
jgi:hypothetical protein